MTGIRNRMESGFSTFAEIVYDHRLATMFIMILFIFLTALRIPTIVVDTSTEGFLHDDDPALTTYERFRDQFGRDEMVIVALKPKTVFDADFLRKLTALHNDLRETVPFLEDITSLVNARDTRGDGDVLIVEDLLENWSGSDKDLETFKTRALGNVMYRNMLLSEDGRFTTLILQTRSYSEGGSGLGDLDELMDNDFSDEDPAPEARTKTYEKRFLTDAENSRVIRAVEAGVGRYDFQDAEVYIGGSPVVTDFLKRTMLKDMKKFMKIVAVTIAIFLFILFRRISGVFMPLLVVGTSLVSTVGLMTWTGTPLKLPTQILPSFILAVGVGDSVHILVIFFHHFNRNGDKRKAISHALGHSGLAIVMTSLTTAGGLLSFSTAAVAPIADLGQFAAAGVFMALVYTVVLLPALLALLPMKPKYVTPAQTQEKEPFTDRFLTGIGNISIQHPKAVITVTGIIILVSSAGAAKIRVSHNPMKWLPEHSPARLANETIDDKLRGSTSLEVIIDTKKENGFYDPESLAKLEKSSKQFETYSSGEVFVGKAWSITTVLKETNQALHENDPGFYTVPEERDLIAQELFLFENSGSDDLEDFTDSGFTKARFTLKVPFINAIEYTRFIDTVEAHFTGLFPDAAIEMTGMVSLFTRVITSAIYSMGKSYGYAIIIITILMVLLIGKVRIGMLSMIPNIAPILVMLGIMGWAGIPMDLFCMLVGSIAIGLAVDDTIHFMHNFRRYYEASNDPAFAVKETLLTTGRAMLVTTCVLSIGFFTFMFASMGNLFNFGLLTGLTIAMALASDYFIAPALMILANPKPAMKLTLQPAK